MKKLTTILVLLFACAPAYAQQVRYDDLPDVAAFVVDERKWDDPDLTYYFQNGTDDISGTGERQAIRDAFELWAEVTPLTFTQVYSASIADIVIRWATGSHGDGNPFDGRSGVLAHAFYPPPNGGSIAGDAHFDDAETWTLSTRSSSAQPMDLVTVAAHEFGHSLGLGHSPVENALMYPYYSGSHRYLSQDDIDGIQSLYILPVPSVYISSGPTHVTEDMERTWTAQVYGGSGSYSISWYIRSSSSDPFYGTCAGATTSCTTSFPDDPNATTDYGAIRAFAIDDVYSTYNSDQMTVIVYEDGDDDGGGGDPPPPPDDCNVVTTNEPGVNAPPPPPLPCYSALVAGQSVQPVPEEFALEGNYPNPFTGRTRIEFALPEAAHVELVVYDVMGRQVATLVDESMKAGFHEVPFEAQGLPSGMYLYRFRAGDTFTDTGRMVVVR